MRLLGSATCQALAGFAPNAHARAKNTVVNFLSRATPGLTAPPLVMGRARSSWVVDLADAHVPITALVAAAGVDSLHALSRLMPHLGIAGKQLVGSGNRAR
jgi:hypothetical protein